jgi:predicted O-methyltransferase YrrM
MTQALQVSPRDKVLEVGTGSGYQAAILSKLARRVYTVERHARLVREARAIFEAQGLVNITAMTATSVTDLREQAGLLKHALGGGGRGPGAVAFCKELVAKKLVVGCAMIRW